MVGIDTKVCDNHARNVLLTTLASTTTIGGISAYTFHKKVKNTKHKTLKTIGVYLASAFVSGQLLNKLYFDNQDISKNCEPYYLTASATKIRE